MKRNKILAALIVFAVLISCMAILFACTPEAQEEDKTVRVRYDYNDGSVVVERTLNRKDVLSIIPPARTGYTFSGWTLDKDGTQEVDTETLEDGSTIYAQWTAEEYFVYFVIESETVKKEKVPYGSKVTPPTTEEINAKLPEGYEFKGWQNFSEDDIITKKTYYYAEIAKIVIPDPVYTVTFTDGAEFNHESKGKEGTKITPPLKTEEPTKGGYTFVGWKTSDGVEFEDGMTIEKNETFYAVWSINRPANPTLAGDDNITYGEKATVSATLANTRDGINYAITWYIGSTKIGEGVSVEVENLGATKADEYHTVRCEVVASDGTLTSDSSSEIFKITVKKAALTATIADINVTYGENLPALNIDYSGFIGNDDESVLNTDGLKADTRYTNKSNCGEYPVSLSGVSADNYDIVSTTAKITVAKKSINGTQKFTFDETYNGSTALKQLDNDCFAGLLDGHTIAFSAKTKSGDVGTYNNDTLTTSYKIVDGDGNDVSNNYTVNCDVEIEITPSAITGNVNNVSLTYNGEWQKADIKNVFVNANVANYVATYSTSEDGEYTSKIPEFKDAGTYTVYFSITAGDNYFDLEHQSFTVKIEKAPITIKAGLQTVVYGKQLSIDDTKYTIDGETFGDDIVFSLACDYQAGDYGVGEYDDLVYVVADESKNPNFDITTQSGTLKVTPAPLTVTLNNDNVVYGNEYMPDVETLIASYDGLFESIDITITTTYAVGNEVGEYEISCTIDNNNYTLSVNKGTLTVKPRALTIGLTLNNGAPVYGKKEMPDFGWYVDPETGSFYGNDGDIFDDEVVFEHGYVAYDAETKKHGNAGDYSVSGYHLTNEKSKIAKNYDITLDNFDFTIATRKVWLDLKEKSVVYGEDIAFDFANDVTINDADGYYGFLEEDDIAKNVTFSTNYTNGNTVCGNDGNSLNWTVAINNANYDVRIDDNGSLYVTARDLKITYEKTNVAQNSGEFSFTIIDNYADGLYADDTIATGKFIMFSTENLGTYEFKGALENDKTKEVRGLNLKRKDDDSNKNQFYNVTFDITLEVVEIPIRHDFDFNNTLTYTYNGSAQEIAKLEVYESDVDVEFAYKNVNTGETGTSAVMPKFTNAGTYEITYTLTKDGKSPYSHTFEVTINPYAFEIILVDPSISDPDTAILEPAFHVEFGDELILETAQRYYIFKSKSNPGYDVWTDLKMSENDLINALNVQIDPGYVIGETGAGSHDVSVTWTNENSNYSITCDPTGQLNVTPQPIVVYGGSYTTVYGEEAAAYTTGFSTRLWTNSGSVRDNYYATLAAQYITLNPKDYTVGKTGTFETEATRTNDNYEVKVCEVKMTVTPRPITIKANDAEMTYGGTLPQFSYSIVSGNLVGDDGATFDVKYLTSAVTGVGAYDITPSVTSDKYDVTVQKGTLTVKQAPLTITLSAKNTTITYGDDMSTYTISGYSGFVNGEDESVISGTLNLVCDYLDAKKAGTFKVSASGLTAANYDITYIAQDLVVKKAPLTVAAVAFDGTITYNSAVPSFLYSASGLVNGDTADILNGKVTFETTYHKGANVGTYTFNVKSVKDLDNYTVTVDTTTQNLEVVKANYTKADVDAALNTFTVSGTYDPTQKLSAFNNQLVGTGFAWVNADEIPTCKVAKNTGYAATYCADATNYNVYTGAYVKIDLAKADTILNFAEGTKDENGNFVFSTDYTGNTINITEVITGISANHTESTNFSYEVSAPSKTTPVKDGGIYTITCTLDETENYNKGTLDVKLKVKYILKDGVSYVLEDLSTLSSGTITLTSYNGVTNVNAFVSEDVTIDKNVTFELLGHADDTGNASTPAYTLGQKSYVDNNASFISHKLTINSGATVTVAGTIIIRGVLGGEQGGPQGHTSGTHSQIINNGEMTLNNGATMAVRGYIKGNGHATYNSGATVYMPFVVNDFRGGTSTRAVYQKGGISPFNVYELPNVQCDQTVMSGAKVIGYLDLYASSKHNKDQKTFIGTDGIIETDGRVEKSYNATTQKTTLTIVGNAKINALKITVMSITVSMADVSFPISWKYDIVVGDGNTATSLSTQYDYKVLPGANITVNKNATLTLTGTAIVYDYFKDVAIDGFGYPSESAANLVVNGTLNLNGSFGGNIQTTQNGAKVVVGSSTTLSVTSKEGNKGDTLKAEALIGIGMKFTTVYTITETARFGAGTYTESIDSNGYVTRSYSGGTALEKGKTYTYNGSNWVQA